MKIIDVDDAGGQYTENVLLTLRETRRPMLLITARCLLSEIRYDEGVVEN